MKSARSTITALCHCSRRVVCILKALSAVVRYLTDTEHRKFRRDVPKSRRSLRSLNLGNFCDKNLFLSFTLNNITLANLWAESSRLNGVTFDIDISVSYSVPISNCVLAEMLSARFVTVFQGISTLLTALLEKLKKNHTHTQLALKKNTQGQLLYPRHGES